MNFNFSLKPKTSRSGSSLSKRQEQVLEFIREAVMARGYAPSIREIGEAIGLSSSSTVHSHLRTLETKGRIRRSPSRPRSIELLDGRFPRYDQQRARFDVLEEVAKIAKLVIAGEAGLPELTASLVPLDAVQEVAAA